MIRKIIFGVICLVGLIGLGIAGWGLYREICVHMAGVVWVLVGAAILFFTGVAAAVVGKFLPRRS